jgi:hypothetical protein
MAIDTSSEDLQDQLEEQQSSSGGYDSTQMQIDQMLSAGWPQTGGGQQASAAPPPPSPYAQPAPQSTPLTPAAAPYQPSAQYQAPAPTQALSGSRVQPYQALATTPPPPLPAPAFMQPQQPPPGAVGMVTDVPFARAGYQMSPEETAAQGQPNIPEPEDKSGFFATEGKALGRGIASAVQSIVPYVTQTVSSVAGGLATMVEQGIGGAGTQTDPNSPSRFLDPSMPFGTEGQQVTPTGPSKVAEVEKNVYSAVTNKANEIGDWVNQQLPPTIKSYADIKSGGDALTYALERVTEMVPQLAVFAAAPGAGQGALAASLPFAAIGALYGFDKANRETNGDPNAIAESMLANAALMGAPPALLASTAGKGLIRNIATAGGINAILGAAGVVQNQTPQAIAQAKSFGDFLDKMSDQDWKQVAEGAVTGAVQGVLIGGAGTYLHPGEVKPTRDVTKVVPGNPADAAQQAALNQALKVPGTTSDTTGNPPPGGGGAAPDTFRTVEQGNIQPLPTAGAAPPAMALNPTLPGLPATAADRGIGQPPPPPPPPGAPLVRGPADLAAQAATVEQARQQAAGTEGDVIPGAAGPAPPAPPPPPPPPLGARQIPEQPGMPGATQAGLPGVEPPPVQPELPLQPGSRLPPQAPGGGPPDGGGPGLPLGDQPQLPFGRAVPEVPITPTEAPPRPVEGVPPEARQGELPGVEPAPPQGELPLRQPPLGGPEGRAGEQPGLPLEEQQGLPFKLSDQTGWRVEPDDQTPGQYVVKHGKDVLAVGSTPEEAMQAARDRADRATARGELPTVGSEAEPAARAASLAEQTRRLNEGRDQIIAEGKAGTATEAAPAGEVAVLEKPAEQAPAPTPAPTAREATAAAKARGEPVGVALVTREQLRKKLGITPERGNVAVAEGTAPEFKTVEEGNVAPKRQSRMAQQVRAALTPGKGRARDIPDESTGKKEAPSSDYKSVYRSRAKEIAGGTNFVDQVMRELPQAGTRGPQRPSFVKYLHDELLKARDDNTIPDLQAKQERARTPEARGRIEDDIQFYKDLREHQAEIQQQIGEALEPRPEGAAALKSAEDELDAELARIKADKAAKHNAPPSPERQVANRFGTPGLDDPLWKIYNRIQSQERGAPTRENTGTSIHEVLDAIADNSKLSTAGLHHARALAAILKKILPESTRVMTSDAAERLYGPDFRASDKGAYFPSRDLVVINSDPRSSGSHVEVALHEAVHAATAHYIDAAVKARSEGRATPEQIRHLDALEAIRKEVADIMMRDSAMTDMEMAHSLYATTDFHELTATLLTNDHAQGVLARSTPSSEFQRTMERLGYSREERATPWSAFRGFLRRAFGLTSSTDNVLGHAMRALGDVADAGARYRRDPAILRGIQDARLRSAVELGGHVLSAPPLSERARDMVTEQVARGGSRLGESLRRGEMNGSNVDAMIRASGNLFRDPDTGANHFADHRAETERGAEVSRAERKLFKDTQQKLNEDIGRLGERDRTALAQFTNDVGYLNAKMGTSDPTANAHLTSSEQLKELQRLQANWNDLPDTSKRIYQDRQDFHQKLYGRERAGDLDSMMRFAAPDSTPADRAAAQQQFYTRAGTQEFLANPDASPLAMTMGERYQNSRKLVDMVARFNDMNRVQGDYFPLRRFGDYMVTYGDQGTPGYGVHMFESRYDAERARADLASGKAFPAGHPLAGIKLEPSQVQTKAEYARRQQVPSELMSALDEELRRRGWSDQSAASVHDVFTSIFLKRATEASARRMGARKGVLGASEDMNRVDRDAYDTHAQRMGFLASHVGREETLNRMQARADYLGRSGKPGEGIQAQDYVNQMRKRMPNLDESQGFVNGAAKLLTNFGFISSLLRPARMPIELVGMHAMNQSLLGGRYGQAAAMRATAKAQGEVGFGKSLRLGMNNMLSQMGGNLKKVNWENGALVRDRMIANGVNPEVANKLYDRMVAANLIDISHASVAAEMGRPGSSWNKLASLQERTVGAMSQMDNAVETMGRMTFAKAAVDLELAKNGGNLDAALDAAMEHARVVTPNWNAYNAPWLASQRGPLGALAKPLFQFRNFALHQFGLYANLTREAYRGGDAGERAIALKQLGGIVAYHALVGGASIPIAEEVAKGLLGAYDWITGRKQPRDFDRIIRTALADQIGPTMAMVATKGLPSLAGVDVSSSLGLNNLLMLPDFRDLSPQEMSKTVANQLFGVSGGDVASLAQGIYDVARGNPAGLIKMVPARILRDMVTAEEYSRVGVKDSRGRVILPSSQISTGDVIAKAIGFNPMDISDFYAGRKAINDFMAEEKDERSQIFNRAVIDGLGAVGKAVSEFNRNYPGNPITYDSLVKAQQEARKNAPGTYGLTVSPKQLQQVRQQTRFLPQ